MALMVSATDIYHTIPWVCYRRRNHHTIMLELALGVCCRPAWVGTNSTGITTGTVAAGSTSTGTHSASPPANPWHNISKPLAYTMNWIKGIKAEHGLDTDFIGVWNERDYSTDYILQLREASKSHIV